MRGKIVLCKSLVVAVVVTAGLALAAAPANACMGCICEIDPEGTVTCICIPSNLRTPTDTEGFGLFDSVVLRFPERSEGLPTKAEIGIYGYSTTHIENGFACVVAIPKVPGIVSVDSVVNYNSETSEPLPGVTFTANPSSAEPVGLIGDEEGVGTGEPWFTFVSHITQKVENGIPNHFVLEVTLDGKTTPDELIRNLQQYGAFFTGSSDQQGVPDGGHLFLKKLGDFDVMTVYPGKRPDELLEPTRLTPFVR